jgi:hypothetical protein
LASLALQNVLAPLAAREVAGMLARFCGHRYHNHVRLPSCIPVRSGIRSGPIAHRVPPVFLFTTERGLPLTNRNQKVKMAERVGFEPTVEFPQHTLSKRAP